jgi:hypothetical protein
MLQEILHDLKAVRDYPAVSILFNTHRTYPENEKDAIVLKNKVKEVEERLLAEMPKRMAQEVIRRVKETAESVDHRKNLDSLALFATKDKGTFVHLPLQVEDRVIVDHTFATRDLLRALLKEGQYYVLTLSQRKARLYQAFNDTFLEEVREEGFPMKNKADLAPLDKMELSMARGTDNRIREFFNRVDKALLTLHHRNPEPVIIAGVERNYHFYREVADKPGIIAGWINQNRDESEAYEILQDAWKVMRENHKKLLEEAREDLAQAVSANRFTSDLNQIWRRVREGRGDVLYVEKNFFQPAKVRGDELVLVEEEETTHTGIVDDIVDEIAEHMLRYGGQVVFLDDGSLTEHQGMALKLRY